MSAEIVELKQDNGPMLPVTSQDMEALKNQRELLKIFVSSQLKRAKFDDKNAEGFGEGDYGIIPGTKKETLLKPGAEKILRLFNLGLRIRLADKEIDRHANFALFTYRAEVYHLRTGIAVAECEGSANSQEVKYRERTVWRKNQKGISESVKEETPICDVLNTLMKMAQKRAMIGATILATAASDYFNHDIESPADAEAVGMKARVEKDVKSEVVGGPSEVSDDRPPVCCSKEMMVSKYPDRDTGEYPWYCLGCKSKKPRVA